MTKYDNITLGMAYSWNRQEERFKLMQTMLVFRNIATSMLQCFGHSELRDHLELTPITSVMIAPEAILLPKFKPYLLIGFDYNKTTTHFRELISLN